MFFFFTLLWNWPHTHFLAFIYTNPAGWSPTCLQHILYPNRFRWKLCINTQNLTDLIIHVYLRAEYIHPICFSMFTPIPEFHRNMSKPHTEQRLILVDSWSSLHVSVPNQRWSPTALVCGPTKEGRGAGVAQGRGEGHGASPNSQRRRRELLRSEFSGSRELPLHTPSSAS